MRIALCIITKGDEELEQLKVGVKSALPAVDRVYITANHEHIETKKWCEEEGYNFSYLEWNDDFAEQRNFNFSQAKGYDYILWMDYDDVIVGADLIKNVAEASKKQGYDTVFFNYWYGAKFDGKPSVDTFVESELTQQRERLIDPTKITWKKRIHETPVPIDGKNFKYSRVDYSKEWPIVWLHLGADRDMGEENIQKKMDRNRRLLELELEDERKQGEADPRTLLYLMKIYTESEDTDLLTKCVDMGYEYLQKSGWDQERAVCCQLMGRCMGKLGAFEQARDFLHDAIKEYPYDPLLYLYLAKIYFDLQDYRAMKHWMQLGINLPVEDSNSGFNNILELKVLSAELMTEYYLNGEKNIRKAYDSAKLLNKVNPTENNQKNEEYLYQQKELDIACEHVHKFMQYLIDNNKEEMIEEFYETLPKEIQKLPFAMRFYNRYKKPKVWDKNEICYFANFQQPHFEKWDSSSLEKGLGGSETAVIKLSEEWAKKGWKVTVYGDPFKEGEQNGVLYLPWFKFNARDHFNIFIQWRHSSMANRVNCKKFLVDLHDVWFPETHWERLDQIDKFMVKSNYHRKLGTRIQDKWFKVIPNGI